MDILGVSLAVLVTGLLARHFVKERRYRDEHRRGAESTFNQLSVPSTEPRYAFEGATATVVDEDEIVEKSGGVFLAYTLTRIAQTPKGEYFWFYFRSDSPPQIKHLDHSRARVLLKGKYRESTDA